MLEARVLNILSKVGRIGTITFGLISTINLYRYWSVIHEPLLLVDTVVKCKDQFIGKVIQIIGETDGNTHKVKNS